jgi:hypothetical protein
VVGRAGIAALVAIIAVTLAPSGDARQQARGCCYDAGVVGYWNRLTNTAEVSWTLPYPDLVTDSVQVGTTIAPTGFLADDGGHVAQPGTTGPIRIGTPAFPIDTYVYVQVWFKCVPRDPARPDCGPIAAPAATPIASLPSVVYEPLEPPVSGPDFTLSASSDGASLEVTAGGPGTTATIWVIQENGFYESVDFTTSPPPGLTVSFAPKSSATGTAVTVSAGAGTPTGNYTVTVEGTTGPVVHTEALAVAVSAAPPTTTPPKATTPPKPKAKPKAKAKKKPKPKPKAKPKPKPKL